jgi:hypothetical protein
VRLKPWWRRLTQKNSIFFFGCLNRKPFGGGFHTHP